MPEMRQEICVELWHKLATGGLRVTSHGCNTNHCWLSFAERGKPLTNTLRSLTERFLLGESQKAIAVDKEQAVSTISTNVTNALRTLGVSTSPNNVPAVLVLLVNGAFGKFKLSGSCEEAPLGASWDFVVKRPTHKLSSLSPCVRRAIDLRFEGKSHIDVAKEIGNTTHTIRNQTGLAYKLLGVSNRIELIIHLGENEPCSLDTPCIPT